MDWDNYPETAPESRLLVLIEQESTVNQTTPFKEGDRVGHKDYPKWEGTVKRLGCNTVYVKWDGYADVMTHPLEYITVLTPVIENEVAVTLKNLEERRAMKVASRKADQAQVERYEALIKNLDDRIVRTLVEVFSIDDQIKLLKTKNEH